MGRCCSCSTNCGIGRKRRGVGGAENAEVENAGVENAGVDSKGVATDELSR